MHLLLFCQEFQNINFPQSASKSDLYHNSICYENTEFYEFKIIVNFTSSYVLYLE